MGPRDGLDGYGEEKTFTPTEAEPRTFQALAGRCTSTLSLPLNIGYV
jgi:hypothetical protein